MKGDILGARNPFPTNRAPTQKTLPTGTKPSVSPAASVSNPDVRCGRNHKSLKSQKAQNRQNSDAEQCFYGATNRTLLISWEFFGVATAQYLRRLERQKKR